MSRRIASRQESYSGVGRPVSPGIFVGAAGRGGMRSNRESWPTAITKIAETTGSAAAAADQLEAVASKKAGLLGVSGISNDMRDLREAIAAGNAKARLAVDKFCWTIARWIGSYVAELNGLDMLVFTGGIGENDIASRAEICAGLGALGIVLDAERNNTRGAAVISADDSPVTVRVLPPLEDLIIVNHVVRLLGE